MGGLGQARWRPPSLAGAVRCGSCGQYLRRKAEGVDRKSRRDGGGADRTTHVRPRDSVPPSEKLEGQIGSVPAGPVGGCEEGGGVLKQACDELIGGGSGPGDYQRRHQHKV